MRVRGFHFIFTCYGFWLPNDPRGSWSDVIRRFDLLVAGRATKTHSTRSLAAETHDQAARLAAKRLLKYPPVRLDGIGAREAGHGVSDAAQDRGYTIHAMAILPDHVHLVTAWHARPIDQIAAHIKSCMTRRMNVAGCHPLAAFAKGKRTPSPWARNYWCPFIWDDEHMRIVIRYVEANPGKAGLAPQRWRVVTPLGY